jgi:hypothetical protein
MRLFAAFLPFVRNDEFLLSTDVNVWPISGTDLESNAIKGWRTSFQFVVVERLTIIALLFHVIQHTLLLYKREWKRIFRLIAPNITGEIDLFGYMATVLRHVFDYSRNPDHRVSLIWYLDEFTLSFGRFLLNKASGIAFDGYAPINRS